MPGKKTKTARSSAKKTTVNTAPETTVPAPVQPDVLPAPAASASVEASPAPGGIDEAKRAAVALNLCMVSLSQIVDYNDINILRMEYDSILNNINMECFPKDDALFDALNAILDTCHFFMLHEKDRELLKKKQALKLKAGLSNINFFGVISTGNPYAAAASLALMIGVAAVNYKTQKARAEYENEAEEWALEKSALEQLHRLRGALFATAWRLADKYRYPDAWRLSEKQIKLYDEILADPDPFSRLIRLETIQDKFEAYPPFFYYMAHAAIETANDDRHKENNAFRKTMYDEAKSALKQFIDFYSKAELLREDLVAASAFLDWAEIKYGNGELYSALESIAKAQKLAGFDFAVLQNCVFQYLRIITDIKAGQIDGERLLEKSGEAEKQAIKCLMLLVANDYNLNVNSRILSGLYIEQKNKRKYDELKQLVSNRSSFVYRHIFMWDGGKETDGKKYEEEVRQFFNSPQLSYTIFRFFVRSIVLAAPAFFDACNKTLIRKDSTPLCAFFDDKTNNGSIIQDTILRELANVFSGLQEDRITSFRYGSWSIMIKITKDAEKKALSWLIDAVDSNSKKSNLLNPFSSGKPYSEKDYKNDFTMLEASITAVTQTINSLSFLLSYYIISNYFDKPAQGTVEKVQPNDDHERCLRILDFIEEQSELKRKRILKVAPDFKYMTFDEFKEFIKSEKFAGLLGAKVGWMLTNL